MPADRETPVQPSLAITVVGPGRLGRSLALLWRRAGHRIATVGRDTDIPPGDALVLTVPDNQISLVAARLPPTGVALHCSGATDLVVFGDRQNRGSLHPVMTFPGPEVALPDLRGVPAAVDGDAGGLSMATRLARDLGLDPVRVPGDRRLYHGAAALAGNGATTLLAHARAVLIAAGVPSEQARSMLVPLVLDSIRNAAIDPVATLTGPAARGDHAVLDGHREAMTDVGLGRTAELHRAIMRAAAELAAQNNQG